jgi:hypothetical protein
MLKIGVYSDKFDSVRDFYRGLGVLSRLRKCRVTKLSLESLLIFEHYDIIFLSSPIHSTNLNVIQYAKDQGIPIWTDYDDYIPDVQTDNAAYDFGSQPGNINTMFACVRESAVVTVTTEFLRQKLLKHNKNVIVLPNAFNDYCFRLEYNLGKNEVVSWRGAIDGHGRDLAHRLDDLIKLDNRFDDNGWTFSFNSRNPWYVTDHLRNWLRQPELPFFQFMHNFKQLNPAVFIYPLYDCEFNRSKSHLAWLDATYAGAACVMPNYETYAGYPVLKYKDSLFEETMSLIEDPKKRKDLYERSMNMIGEQFCLTTVNKQRQAIAESICP